MYWGLAAPTMSVLGGGGSVGVVLCWYLWFLVVFGGFAHGSIDVTHHEALERLGIGLYKHMQAATTRNHCGKRGWGGGWRCGAVRGGGG